MALDWNISNCENWESLTDSEEEYRKTEYIVFTAMAIGVPKITKDTYRKYYMRMLIYRDLNGDTEEYITLQDLKKRIGLWTNASKKTEAAFGRYMVGSYNTWAMCKLETLESEGEVSDVRK